MVRCILDYFNPKYCFLKYSEQVQVWTHTMVGSTNKVDIVKFIFYFCCMNSDFVVKLFFLISAALTFHIISHICKCFILLQASLSARGRKRRGNWPPRKCGNTSVGECAKSMLFFLLLCLCIWSFFSLSSIWLTDYHNTHLISNI